MPLPARPFQRLAVLTEGSLDIYRNKTAMGLIRFRPQDVICVVDSTHAGADLEQLTGAGKGIRVVASVADAIALGIDWVVIGVSTPGGFLPQELRPQLYDAIRHRVGVISGLHNTVDDPNLVSLAARYAVELVNLRKLGSEEHGISTAKARSVKAWRILTVGTDASIGKTVTSLALHAHLQRRGVRTGFAATGHDGILIMNRGICVDRQISDFAGGAVERLVLEEAKGVDVLVVEGQNSILSPCYSGTALSVLHGSCPDAMILCHTPNRTHLRNTDVPVPTLTHVIELYQAMLHPLHPGRVVGIALNTVGMTEPQAQAALAEAARSTGLPVADVVREGEAGCARLAAACLAPGVAARRVRAPLLRQVSAASAPRAARSGSGTTRRR